MTFFNTIAAYLAMIGKFAVVDKSPYHAARVNVSRNAFFSSRSEKNISFDVDIAVKKEIQMWFIVVYSYRRLRVITLFPNNLLWSHWAVPRESTTF